MRLTGLDSPAGMLLLRLRVHGFDSQSIRWLLSSSFGCSMRTWPFFPGDLYRIYLVFASANETEAAKQMVTPDLYRWRYNIGCWSRETETFPPEWQPFFSIY